MRTLRDESRMGRLGTAGSKTFDSELAPSRGLIELTLDKPSQLFHAFDPSPIGGRELDEKVEQFIVRSAQDNPTRQYNLLVHIADEALFRDDEQRLSQAIRAHFAHRRDHSSGRADKHSLLELPSFLHVAQQVFLRSRRCPRPSDRSYKKVS